MKKFLLVALLAAAASPLAGCHSCAGQARFWSVNNGAAYTVDTTGAPLGQRVVAEFVDAQGRMVEVRDVAISSITQAQYTAMTSGAGYSLSYCPIMKSCWALPTAK